MLHLIVPNFQVHKLDKDFKVLLTLGEKLVPGHDDSHFCQPTDVAVAKNGYDLENCFEKSGRSFKDYCIWLSLPDSSSSPTATVTVEC